MTDMKITISGPESAGKSVLMADIAGHLKSLGHNVTCVEGEYDNHPVTAESWIDGKREPRNIRINTRKTP